MVKDENVPQERRYELAQVLLEMAQPLGSVLAHELFLAQRADGQSLISSLIDPSGASLTTNLRLAVILKLDGLIDAITVPRSEKCMRIVRDLCADKNWRVRHAALQLLPRLTPMLTAEDFDAYFVKAVKGEGGDAAEGFVSFANDNCALIRTDWIKCCQEIGAAYGAVWLEQNVLEAILQKNHSPNYQMQAVVLEAAVAFGVEMPRRLVADLLPAAVEMTKNRVPNLQLLAALALGEVAAKCKAAFEAQSMDMSSVVELKDYMRDSVIECLQKLESDADPDVSTDEVQAIGHVREMLAN